MKYIITENRMVGILKRYCKEVLDISPENLYYSWTDFNCGWGVCCDPYSAGFWKKNSDYNNPFFKLVMSKHYDDDGDYPEELYDELPEECEQQPDITDPKFDTYIVEDELAEELNNTFGDSDIWEKSLLILLNDIFGTQATDILIRDYDL